MSEACEQCRKEIDDELKSLKIKIEYSEKKFYRHIDISETATLAHLDGLGDKLDTFIKNVANQVNDINDKIKEIKAQISDRNFLLKSGNGKAV